jgi:NitT/TauT family transport system substrate-binding protein
VVGDLPALKAASESGVRIVSLIQQGPCSIIARQAQPIHELRGHRIGYAPGSNAHYTLLKVLRENGVHPEDVKLVPLEVIEMADALASGRIDAFSAWEPTPTLTLLDHPTFEVLARADARGYLYFARPFFLRQPRVVRALVASEIRALRWLRLNDRNLYIACGWARERAVRFGGTELPLTVYDYHRLARRDILRVPTAPRLVPGLLEPPPTAFIPGEVPQQFRVSRELGMIAADAEWQRVRWSFAADVVPEILSDAARHRLDDLRLGPSLPMQGVSSVPSPSGAVPTPTNNDASDSR